MGRKICTECNTVFEDKVLIDKNSENCLVCGASLRDMDEPQLAPEENDNSLITWYYYCTGRGFYLSDEPLEGYRLEYKFKAPKDLDKAKEILRKEYDSTAFATPSVSTKPEPVVRCPRCGCTSVQLVPKKWSFLTGYRTNSVNRVCVNCKHRW
ncbi:hypothetical protein GN277_12760 [Lachnospiraceae bacterium WCA-9-b2]|uniref:Uncharacterized protein n=1 Tax=Sporofaciens musculi TaxID=2681861 RepID=A0A7X3MHB6_9FIRM|nr:hypothetical protein [Sporofaciens musculi]MXP76232.1 hypothetical protein [Sporofaciens musculi]